MKKKIITIATIGLSVLMLAACTQQTTQTTEPAPTTNPESYQIDASLSGQIDISDDAVTQRQATMSSSPAATSKTKMPGDVDDSR